MTYDRQAQPMIITLPNGNIINVQSLKAGATLLGRIYHRISGDDGFHLDHKGLKNMIKCGIKSFHEGPLTGYSFEILGETDNEHWDALLDMLGAEGIHKQTYVQSSPRVGQELAKVSPGVGQELAKVSPGVGQELAKVSPGVGQELAKSGPSTYQHNNITTNQNNNITTEQHNNITTETIVNNSNTEIDEFESMWNNSSQVSKPIVPEDEFWAKLKQKAVTAPVVITENENKVEKSYSENLHSRYSV